MLGLFILLAIPFMQGLLAIGLAHKLPHWTRLKLASLSASPIAVCLAFVAVLVLCDEYLLPHASVKKLYSPGFGGFLLGEACVVWLLGIAIAWGMLALMKLPEPPDDGADIFE